MIDTFGLIKMSIYPFINVQIERKNKGNTLKIKYFYFILIWIVKFLFFFIILCVKYCPKWKTMHLKKSEMNSENIGYIYIWKRQSGTYSGMGIQRKHHKNYKVAKFADLH